MIGDMIQKLRAMQIANPDALGALGAGMLSGQTTPQALAMGFQGMQGARQQMMERQKAEAEQARQQAQMTATAAFLKARGADPSLIQMAQSGAGKDAFDMWSKTQKVEETPTDEFGLNPQYGTDANGNPVLLQLSKSGRAMQTAMPDGVTLSKEPIKLDAGTHFVLLDPISRQAVGTIPKENYREAYDTAAGKEAGAARADAQLNLGTALQKADYSIQLIDDMINHPGRETATGTSGLLDPRNYIPGTDATNFRVRRQQLEGRTFLEAFESLKGGGQITEVEGRKATEAIARLNTAQSDDEYLAALRELRGILEIGKARAMARAGVSETQPVTQQPAAPQRYRFNPQTGELE